jgi:type I restriction enzyme, S subunit
MNGEWMKSGRGEYSVSELPKGWKIATLGELGTWSSGGTPSRKNPEYYGGSIPWVKTGDLRDDYIGATEELITDAGLKSSSAKVFPAGTLLLAMYGATIGRTGVLKIDAATNQACAALIAEGLTRDLTPFLWWFFIHKADEFKAIGQGGAQPNISQAIIKDFPVALPPLNEQRRIVAKLDSLFARSRRAREELERVAGLCDRYRRSVLAAACSGQLTADWREQNPYIESASELLKQIQQENLGRKRPIKVSEGISNPFELPEGWKWARLFDICRSITDGDHLPPPQSEAGVPFLTISNITTGKINFDKTRYVPESYYQKIDQTRKPYKGDILYTAVGATYGTPVLVDTKERFCFQRHIAILKPSLLLDAQCLLYILKSDLVYSQATNVVTGTAQPTVPLSGLRVIKVPLPPLIEQKEIVLRVEKLFNAIAQLEAEYQKALKLCDRLDQAILTQAFSGNLVPQDPTDEPADVLLDRIRAEKQDLPKSKKLRSKHKPATRSLPLNSAEDRL